MCGGRLDVWRFLYCWSRFSYMWLWSRLSTSTKRHAVLYRYVWWDKGLLCKNFYVEGTYRATTLSTSIRRPIFLYRFVWLNQDLTCDGFCIVGSDTASCGCGPDYQLAVYDMQSCIGMYDKTNARHVTIYAFLVQLQLHVVWIQVIN